MRSKLISTELTRAEFLTEETRKKHNLPKEGLVIMETWNDEEVLND